MRKLLVLIAIVAQVVVLATMVFGRESVVQNGDRVYLRTAPLDPRDPFRGDFVRLQYPMNEGSAVAFQWSSEDYVTKKGDKVYAVLRNALGTVHEVAFITNEEPASGQFIRGRITSSYGHGLVSNVNRLSGLRMKFGVEQLFVQQGTGLDIEEIQGLRGGLQVPLEVEIALGSNGVAVITGYRWSPLGMELTFIGGDIPDRISVVSPKASAEDTNDANGNEINQQADALDEDVEQQATISIYIENVSNETITLNNPGNNCGFTIVGAGRNGTAVTATNSDCNSDLEPTVLSLAAGENYTFNIDLADPRWFISDVAGTPTDIRNIDDGGLYRIVYRTPPNSPKEDDNQFWMGEMASRAFSNQLRID